MGSVGSGAAKPLLCALLRQTVERADLRPRSPGGTSLVDVGPFEVLERVHRGADRDEPPKRISLGAQAFEGVPSSGDKLHLATLHSRDRRALTVEGRQ